MKSPHIHISRYTAIYRTAMRKGFELDRNADGTWTLTKASAPVTGASNTDFDNVVTFLRTQPLPG